MKRPIFDLVILALVVSVFLGCGDSATNHQISEATVDLSLGQTVDLGFDNLELGFYRILDDSRCPMNAYCLWPGMGEITVYLLKRPMHDPAYVRVAIVGTAVALGEKDDVPAYVDQYRIRLIGLAPYPTGFDPIDSSEYVARIKVTKIDGSIPPPKIQTTFMEPTEIMLDPIDIDSVSLSGSDLLLKLSHGGCCKKHYYWLYMSPPGFTKSNPPQADIYLRHFANNDSCECLTSIYQSFDLKPIIDLYDSTIGDMDSVRLNLYDYYEDSPLVPPHAIILHKD
ncbi:exported hypothetical protein [Candidatus Zixiibacteriota bacterium]|nr:exported hypothetical protein [candidate division Zixibacteria bacterium]